METEIENSDYFLIIEPKPNRPQKALIAQPYKPRFPSEMSVAPVSGANEQ